MEIIDLLKLPFFQNAIIAGVIVGILTAVLGTFVVLRRMSFIGTGIAHSAFGGVALGILIGIDPFVSALTFCIFTGFLIAFTSRKFNISEDSAVGVFFPAMMSLGIILLAFVKGYSPNLLSYLFGDILLVSKTDIIISLIVFFIVIIFISVFYREMTYITFDSEFSKVIGIPVEIYDYFFISLISLAVVISIKIVGIILVSALLVIPPLSALKFSRNYIAYIILSVSVGIIVNIGGVIVSYYLNMPPGATIVIFATLIFLLSLFAYTLKSN